METIDGMDYWIYDGKAVSEFRTECGGREVEGGIQP